MKKKRVAITAPTGMLGSMVYNILKDKYHLILLYRNGNHLKLLEKTYGGLADHTIKKFDLKDLYQQSLESKYIYKDIEDLVGDVDAIINCAGIIKPYANDNPGLTLFINSIFPHMLSTIYRDKLIQITTDCVFDGVKDAPYDETSPYSANDLYGISKSVGEPSQRSLVLRTSIIGPELHSFVSLISWIQKQKGEIYGFRNHLWNGITTKQFAKICDMIISKRKAYPANGLFHIFSTDVTKFDMLVALKKRYKLSVTIEPKQTQKIDRRLNTIYDLNTLLKIPSFEVMVDEL